MDKKNYELEIDINNSINYLYRFIIDFNNCSYEFSYKDDTLSASEAEAFGKALLCIPEDEDFGEIMNRSAAWEE